MKICNTWEHDEVAYETHNCPACEALSEKEQELEDARSQIAELEDRIAELETDVDSLEGMIEELKKEENGLP